MFKLKNKVVVITGGTRGIGYETARAFLEQGSKVVIMGSRAETVEIALKKLQKEGFTAAGFHPALTDYTAVRHAFSQIHEQFGQIDVLINNAGISADKRIEDTSSADFTKIMALNVEALFNTCKAVVPIMKAQGGGVILNTSSMVSIYGQPSGVGYPTSKFAVNGLTRSLARELAVDHIRVNAVAPGVINTDMVASLPEDILVPLAKSIPLGRIGEPRDIANAFLFLASDMADYITGVVLQVDGAAHN